MPTAPVNSQGPLPRWDGEHWRLYVGDTLVKQFTHRAPNQFRILDEFESLGWPEQIDDPLPYEDGVNTKVRFHDTIQGLNRGMLAQLIRFHGNGDGTAVRWSLERQRHT